MIAKSGSCTRVLRRTAYHIALAVLLVIPVEASGDTVTLFMTGPKTVREGDLVDYRLEVVNESAAEIENVAVRDELPAEVTFVDAVSTSGGFYDAASGLWHLPSLGTDEEDKSAVLRLQALARSDLLTDPSDVATTVNQALVVTPEPSEPIAAEVATNIVCGFCIDWEIESVDLDYQFEIEDSFGKFKSRYLFHVRVANNGPLASEATVAATHFNVSGGGFSPSLALQPPLSIAVSLDAGVTQTVTFATNWAEGPDSSYSLSWEFETSDFSLLDPVIPNTEAGSRHFDVEGGPDGGSGCFIATATFGSHLNPHVQRLRWFRDETLMKNQFGRTLVAWYYELSPPIARHIEDSEVLKLMTRIALIPLIFAIDHPFPAFYLLCGILVAPFVLRRTKGSLQN